MITFLTIVYLFVCVFLILVVLLQAGRGGGMGAAFGGSSQTVFGGAGAGNFLTRLTVIMAALFMLLSATLAYLSSGSDKALEKAAQAVKAREEARDLGPAPKDDSAKAATDNKLTSSAPPDGGAAAAPLEESPVEGAAAPAEGAAPAEQAPAAPAPDAPAPDAPAPAAPGAPPSAP